MKKTLSKSKSTPPDDTHPKQHSFPIVAIGASAGGLEAITALLANVSPDTGMAFIYVQHLSPDHKSLLTTLLGKSTTMKVQEIASKVLMKPNHVYVMPPDKEITVTNGHIEVSPRPTSKITLPIDILFSSLAQTHKEKVIGIILSGSASDGTIGMKAIKHEGGLTFAQDKTATFGSMPASAIAAGVVDYILPPMEIALELNRLSTHPLANPGHSDAAKEELMDKNDPAFKEILALLLKSTHVDFSAYKMATIKRRIIRRVFLHKLKTTKEYAKYLAKNKEEVNILFQDLLINVTSFFRDVDYYKYLKSTLLPKLLKSKIPGDPLRIWVPACSTGEEAYSIAMMILEIQDTTAENIPVQLFATDLSENAIQKARIGLYSKNEIQSVMPKRVLRFFTKSDNGYLITKSVRNMCVFAPHNILTDPPFSRIDFISCRNLFIYLDIPAQKQIISIFHYALNDGGYVMLGKSETISTSKQLFTEVNKKFKIYLRKDNATARTLPTLSQRKYLPERMVGKAKPAKIPTPPPTKIKSTFTVFDFDKAIDAALIKEFMPPCVVINYQLEILQFRGSTDLFLTHPPGKATFHILKMVHPELAFSLRNAIQNAIKTKKRVTKTDIEIKTKDTIRNVAIDIVPLKIELEEPLLLILFSERVLLDLNQESSNGKSSSNIKDRRIQKLEEELSAAHSDALAYSHDHDLFAQELQSVNEEVVSSNEELQTVNEELETSKEEIESANEELTSTNQELQTRNDLLIESYEYSKAIIATMHEPLIILDKVLRVKTANKSFYEKFGVKEEETEGILLYDLGNRQWNIPQLRELLENIVPKNSFFKDFKVTHFFEGIGERVLMLNANRIIQKSHGEQLILLSINDITESMVAQQKEKDILNRDIKETKNYNTKLKQAVKERTYDLHKANVKLAEKISELEKMNKELEAFAYVSSHDLQEPLRKIQIFAGRILDIENKNLSDRGKNYFRLMRSSAERMQALIHDLLAFSHLSTTHNQFAIVDLFKILDEVKIEFKEQLVEKNAVITAKGNCEVYTIPYQFRQVLQNLLSNALKFSRPNVPPLITLSCKLVKYGATNALKLPAEKDYCHIRFSDNGIGFENRFSDKIFEVFEKLHGKDEYPGTGIGLAIVKKIIDNHNGKITVKSALNIGTTFDIYIPAD